MIIKKNLFNWIGDYIINKNCLDLFSGTGNLGLEAISRYSRNVILIEKNKFLFKNLLRFKKKFNLKNLHLINNNVFNCGIKFNLNFYFDIIFLDPPYKNVKFILNCLKIYFKFFKKNSLIFIESIYNIKLILNYFLNKLELINKNNLGKINYFLLRVK